MAPRRLTLGLHWPNRPLADERPNLGYLFVAKARKGHLWIGWSNNPKETVKIIQRYSVDAVHLVGQHSAAPGAMIHLHNALAADRVRVESCWFRPTEAVATALKRVGIS